MGIFRNTFFVVLALLMLERSANADLFDTYGFGAQDIAMAGACSASVDNLSALYYNPAGLGKVKGHSLGLSYLYFYASLDVSGATTPLPDDSDLRGGTMIISLGLDINKIINISHQATFAFCLSMKDDGTMVQLEDLEEKEFSYIKYGSALSRSVIYMGLGVEVIQDLLNIGLGAHTMIGGEVAATMTMNAEDLSTTQEVIPSKQNFWMKMEMKPYPIIGIMLTPTKDLSFGLTYRDGIEVEMDPFLADITLTLGSHAANINAYTAILSFMQPSSYQGGVAYRLGDITLEGDINYERWSEFKLSVPREMRRITPELDDVISFRLGLEYRMKNMKLWAGYQYEPTPLPTDMNGSHYLDSDRHIFGLGAGTSFKDPWGLLFKPMELSAAIQEKYLPKKTFESAGTSYSLKGNVISGMLSIKFPL
jgi:long-subunit fatty acid transport protein